MAFVPWKDRVTSTPHRYKLTEVSADTYDLEAVPGSISEAGTPVNAANLNKLIQRDGDDIKDTVVAFTEASTRANIATGEKTSTIFGKIKKWYTDLKTHAFTTPSATQSTSADTVPSSKLLKESSFARVYRSLGELTGITSTSTPLDVMMAMDNSSVLIADISAYANVLPTDAKPSFSGGMLELSKLNVNRAIARYTAKENAYALNTRMWFGEFQVAVTGYEWSDWHEVVSDKTAQTITGVKTYTASPIVPTTPSGPSAAVAKSYVDGLSTPYDKVIRTQTEFEELISSPNWLGAESVALVGQFTLSTANNSGIKVPATVKQIHGFNSAKITITNFLFNPSTSNAGLWYNARPTTLDYSICDLEVDCAGTGLYGIGFNNCTNLTNCTGTGTGDAGGYGFYNCTNLTNCTGRGTGTGGYGFRDCTNLTNCTGTGTGDADGFGFYNCTNLTNCTGTGTGDADGFGFAYITRASNCKDGGSTTAMWGGTNKNIDLDTCCKTPVTANNTTLNT